MLKHEIKTFPKNKNKNIPKSAHILVYISYASVGTSKDL